MTEEEIILAKEKYSTLVKEKEKLNMAKERLLELEKNPYVKEYLELSNFVNDTKESYEESDMIWESFIDPAITTECSNEILAYMGAYEKSLSSSDKLTVRPKADYILYKDIETGNIFKINPYDNRKFENEHKVVYLPIEHYKKSCYNEEYTRLRYKFFKDLLDKPQEEVVSGLVKKKTR